MPLMSEIVRRDFKAGDDVRDAGLTTPEDIERFDDIVYGTDKTWQSLDVYRPKSAKGKKLPVIVSIHGGGWVYGDKERYQYYCMSLSQHGFAVVNFTYRLAPEFLFPAALEDTNLVFEWIFANSEEYGLDTKHIFAVGDSAGAHYLGLYTCICTNPDYAKKYDFQVPGGFVPTAVALNCGKYQIKEDVGYEMTTELIKELLPGKGTPEELEFLDVTKYVTKKFPPVFLMTCTGDFLKWQALLMAQKLMEMDVPFVSRYYGDAEHELGHVFHCNMKMEEGRRCNKDECDYFKSFLE